MKRQTVPGIQISGVCLLLWLLVTASIGCSKYKSAGPADGASEQGAEPAELPKNQEERGA